MKIQCVPATELTDDHLLAWDRLQQSQPHLDSPFYRPEFTVIAGELWPRTEVAVIEEDGEVRAFFPFERRGRYRGVPLAETINDFQGIIAPKHFRLSAEALLQPCGLHRYRFDHIPAEQTVFAPYEVVRTDSPWIDLSQGFDAYCRQRAANTRVIAQMRRKMRQVERTLGPIRLELDDQMSGTFGQFLEWKAQRDRQRGVASIVDVPWFRPFAELLLRHKSRDFTGYYSTLWVGDTLAAVHLGMASRRVFHLWFMTYNPDLHRYSPGVILVLTLCRELACRGFERFDLGKGDYSYKHRLKSGDSTLLEGIVTDRVVTRLAWKQWLTVRDYVRCSPLRGPAHRVDRWLAKGRLWLGGDR